MSMAVHGALAAFNPCEEDWSEYSKRLTFYFSANGITMDTKKRAVLLSCCGPAIFRLLRSLVLPGKLDNFSFKELVTKMKEHKELQPSVVVHQFQFNTWKQQVGETVAEYVAALCKAAEICNYGDLLSEMLQDHLVCNITGTTVHKWLLAEKDLTLDKAVSLAQSVEIEEKGAKDLQLPTEDSSELHKLTQGAFSGSESKSREAKHKNTPICFRCGGRHLATKCYFISEECYT